MLNYVDFSFAYKNVKQRFSSLAWVYNILMIIKKSTTFLSFYGFVSKCTQNYLVGTQIVVFIVLYYISEYN